VQAKVIDPRVSSRIPERANWLLVFNPNAPKREHAESLIRHDKTYPIAIIVRPYAIFIVASYTVIHCEGGLVVREDEEKLDDVGCSGCSN